ncbi:MAG TPA: histidine kinase dimerization/phosphoacceptor domain -containing protein [Arenibaculum sp.]|nr:histidine kinase dimerization/phosphoacceptor domain -containing protein [Arenibaculum sp.]
MSNETSSDRERLEIVSAAAEWLLSTDDPAAMVGRIFEKASGPLALDYYFNFLVNDAGDALWLHSCAGIPDSAVHDLARLEFGQAICGTVAKRRSHLVVEKVQESADPRAALIKDFGVETYACFPLVARGGLIGTLSFGSRRRTRFTPVDLDLLRVISHYVAVAQERRKAEQAIAAALDDGQNLLQQKEMLLKEVNHRVKNSLQLVSSLLAMQGGRLDAPGLKRYFIEASRRVQAVAAVHHRLYRSGDVRSVPFGPYLRDLCADLEQSMDSGRRVRLVVDTEDTDVPTDKAIPLALMLNELVTNAFKHAYPVGEPGEVRITFGRQDGDMLRLSVADDGTGVPDGLDARDATGLGMTIVRALTTQLGGRFEHDGNGPGARFTVTVPL